ncbi:hypothetical protein B296_00054940 [Ensete ventricosum]|uniref:Uncharacterized protein n=1 Tax=Ensete ventricosum TaxID=4639 RepID=A0A426Y1R9_ENSVE|nr:hypothetical protein B296_00054940 [Ensete ventricosum]
MIELMREEHETLRIPQYLFSRVLLQQQDEAEDKASFFFPFRSRKENERSKKTDFNHVAERQCVGPGGQRLLSPIGRSRSQRAIHREKEADRERPYNRVTLRGASVAHRRHVGGHPVGLRVTSSPSCRCGMLYYLSIGLSHESLAMGSFQHHTAGNDHSTQQGGDVFGRRRRYSHAW